MQKQSPRFLSDELNHNQLISTIFENLDNYYYNFKNELLKQQEVNHEIILKSYQLYQENSLSYLQQINKRQNFIRSPQYDNKYYNAETKRKSISYTNLLKKTNYKENQGQQNLIKMKQNKSENKSIYIHQEDKKLSLTEQIIKAKQNFFKKQEICLQQILNKQDLKNDLNKSKIQPNFQNILNINFVFDCPLKSKNIIFQQSVNGKGLQKFNQFCNNKNNLLFLVQTNQDLIGFFTSITYNAKQINYYDCLNQETFIFVKQKDKNLIKKLYCKNEKKYIMLTNHQNGICLGSTIEGKQDLYIDFEMPQNCCSKLGYAYYRGVNDTFFINGTFKDWQVVDILVFQIQF